MFEAFAEFIAGIFKSDAKIRDESLVGESEFEKECRKTAAMVLFVILSAAAVAWAYFEN